MEPVAGAPGGCLWSGTIGLVSGSQNPG